MADNVNITTPVRVESDAKSRVAYDLMKHIAHGESGPKNRAYYLTLYAQCYQVANGTGVAYIEPQP